MYTEKRKSIWKRIWSAILVIIMTLSLTACGGKFKCDICGEEKTGKRHSEVFFEQKVTICDDCYQTMKSLFD